MIYYDEAHYLGKQLRVKGFPHRWWTRRATRQFTLTIPTKSGIDHENTMTNLKRLKGLRKEVRARGPHGVQTGPVPAT